MKHLTLRSRSRSWPGVVWIFFCGILASFAPSAFAIDALALELFKGQAFLQTTNAGPTPVAASPYLFKAVLVPSFASFVSNVSVQTPALVSNSMPLDNQTNFSFTDVAASQNVLDAAYASGSYNIQYIGLDDGQTSVPVTLGPDFFPPTPVVSNLLAAQSISATNAFSLTFAPEDYLGDLVQLSIVNSNGSDVFETGPIYFSQGISATNSAITILANTFIPGASYAATLQFVRLTTFQTLTLPFIDAGFFSQTTFNLQTLSTNATGGSSPTNGPPTNAPSAPPIVPASFIASSLTLLFTNGSGSFASAGAAVFLTTASGSNYVILGPSGQGLTSGVYSYTVTGTNSATLTLSDTQLGSGLSVRLSFLPGGVGFFSIFSPSSGGQSGLFQSATNYASVPQAQLYLPTLSNTLFQSSFSGQAGGSYSLQSSPDLQHWTTLSTFSLATSATNVTDASASGNRFYRAKLNSVAFAPSSLLGLSLNLSVTAAAAPFTNNAAFQFIASSNGASYQILAAPTASDGAGSYSYALTGPQTASLSYTDSTTSLPTTAQLFFTSATTGSFLLTQNGSLGFQYGSFTTASGSVLFLGDVKFTPDTTRLASGLFPADGVMPLSLTATDVVGYVWTLKIPADALPYSTVISLAPFANIDSSASLMQVASGVQLSPDGTQFLDGVQLTVTAPSSPLGPHATMAIADARGANLSYALTTNQGATYATTIYHFSSGSVGNAPPPPGGTLGAALQAAVAAIDQLKSQTPVLPPPPPAGFACNDQDQAAAGAYAANLFAPEKAAIQRLVAAHQAYAAATGSDPYYDQIEPVILGLIESSCYTKVDLLFATYDQQALVYFDALDASIDALNLDSQWGGLGHPQWNAQLAGWLSGTVVNYYLKNLRNHDYTAVSAIGPLKNEFALNSLDPSSIIEQFGDALTFQIAITISDGGSALTLGASGSVQVSGSASDVFPLTGFDIVNYTAGSLADNANLQLPLSWTQGISIGSIDGCSEPTINVECSPFGSDFGSSAGVQETWVPIDPKQPNFQTTLMLAECNYAFSKKYPAPSSANFLYSFPCLLVTGSPNGVGDFSGDSTYPGGTVSVNFTITHTPQ